MTTLPLNHQLPFPTEQVIRAGPCDAEAVAMDVLFVGAGPAGLAGAIELAGLVKSDAEAGGGLGEVEIGVLEKAAQLGEHCLSGAIVNPRALRELLPGVPDAELPFRGPVQAEAVYLLSEGGAYRVPTPPAMKNRGNQVASVCELVRWLGARAEALGVNIFPGFPVDSLLVEGQRVVGVRTVPTGQDRAGRGGEPGVDITARVTVLAEGTRGLLTQGWLTWQRVGSRNPQIYALGVKELWEVKRPPERVVHTLGWPLPGDAFGGSFMYPMGSDMVALGLVVGLDYRNARLDVHRLLQRMKQHPLFRAQLAGARWSSGAPRRSLKEATTRSQSDFMGTDAWWPGTPPVSWTCPRSRGSTTRCSRGWRPRALSSVRSSRATHRHRGCPRIATR